MTKEGLTQLAGKNVLLLQGPIGPFFYRLAKDIELVGGKVFKINFNGGDFLFYPHNAINFNQPLESWPGYFEQFITLNAIDVILLFGDCRSIHSSAHAIAVKHALEIGVFEEGYLRPDYITLEHYGVNGNSTMSKFPEFYQKQANEEIPKTFTVGQSFWYATIWGMLYYSASVLLRPYFKHYVHHRILSIWQGLYWLRSMYRKRLYAFQQRNVLKQITTLYHKKYYLVPLQMNCDAQISHHSDFDSNDAFISHVINSFANYAPRDSQLVIKHHPLDRGFHHYGKIIDTICQQNASLKSRIFYVHDLHLPTLLDSTTGVVVINSTVGLSALIHDCPVIVCGNAIYDIEQLTYQASLGDFWKDAENFKVNKPLLKKFIAHLVDQTQINGNFYKRIKQSNNFSGVFW